MIIIPSHLLQRIRELAEHAYPEECCGLLVGHGDPASGMTVTRVAAGRNVAERSREDSFEVDPKLRFDLMRELQDGPSRIVGHYHSHPDHPAYPSVRDREMAWETDLVWVIVAVEDGRASRVAAHAIDPGDGRFHEVPIHRTE